MHDVWGMSTFQAPLKGAELRQLLLVGGNSCGSCVDQSLTVNIIRHIQKGHTWVPVLPGIFEPRVFHFSDKLDSKPNQAGFYSSFQDRSIAIETLSGPKASWDDRVVGFEIRPESCMASMKEASFAKREVVIRLVTRK